MLSIVDIKSELGRNIDIYPLTSAAIKSNSIGGLLLLMVSA